MIWDLYNNILSLISEEESPMRQTFPFLFAVSKPIINFPKFKVDKVSWSSKSADQFSSQS